MTGARCATRNFLSAGRTHREIARDLGVGLSTLRRWLDKRREHAALLTFGIVPSKSPFTEMSLHFGFAEAPAVPAALEAHRPEFPIDIAETSFFLGRETPVPTVRPEMSVWREKLYAFMGRNAVGASDYFQIPPKRVVELGTQVEL
jgi:Homeodomain-like domain